MQLRTLSVQLVYNWRASAAQADSVIAQTLLPQKMMCRKEIFNFLTVKKWQHLLKCNEKIPWSPTNFPFCWSARTYMT